MAFFLAKTSQETMLKYCSEKMFYLPPLVDNNSQGK